MPGWWLRPDNSRCKLSYTDFNGKVRSSITDDDVGVAETGANMFPVKGFANARGKCNKVMNKDEIRR